MIEDTPDVLIVDDEKYDIEFMLEALDQHQLTNKAKVFQDGSEALDYLFANRRYSGRDKSKQPKVIVLDLQLPSISGVGFLRIVKSNDVTRAIPVVVFTSSNEDADRIECYRLGANSYIVKPADYDEFVRTVADVAFYWTSENVPPNETNSNISYRQHR